MDTEKKGEAGEAMFFWFVMTRFRYWEWHTTEMEPELPRSMHLMEILPHDIIERMADSQVDPGKINSLEAEYSSHSNRFYDLHFVRFSSNTLLGTVRENVKRKQEVYAQMGLSPGEQTEAAFKILRYAVDNYPRVNRMFSELVFDFTVPVIMAEEKVREKEREIKELEESAKLAKS